MKALDRKLGRIRTGQYTPGDFIIADAKDGDMGFGRMAPGPRRDGSGLKTRTEYVAAMAAMVHSGLVDIMLTSASVAESLAEQGVFAASPVTAAVRLNDTTDIWSQRGAGYYRDRQRPFRTARPDRVRPFCDLGLYSVTFSNDVDRDLETLVEYARFREDCSRVGMRHFLEVFNPHPSLDIGIAAGDLADYINDSIVRCLAGVVSMDRPLFLKIPYNGARAMEELASYDPTRLVVGILGGARGTTRDTFELVSQAEAHGARVALFGRKINFAESPVELVRLMRAVIEHALTPSEAVKEYHNHLLHEGLRADRTVDDDLEISDPVLKHV
jgi:DhnA family fructose-bisphosphate aldolase class Ia